MNDTLTRTLSDLPKYEQDFAKAITGYVDAKYKEYKRQEVDLQASPVPLENIHFGPDDFKNFYHILQEIAKMQGNPRWQSDGEWKPTASRMLGLYCDIDEIKPDRGSYVLTKHGCIYKRLTKKLARTP